MPPAAATTLDAGAKCRTCGRALPPGSAVCPGCGAAQGEANRCPHCGAVADVEPHAALGFRCLVCGGPRVALNVPGVTPSAATLSALRGAGKHQTQHVMYSAAGAVLTLMGALALVIATLVVVAASPGVAPTLAAYLGAAVPAVAGVFSLARAAGARKQRSAELYTAQVAALSDVQAVTGVLDARRIAEIMRLSPERAELLSAEASVASLLEPGAAPRLRVPSAVTQLSDDAEGELDESLKAPLRGDTEI